MAECDTEYDLDSLAAMLDDDEEEDGWSSSLQEKPADVGSSKPVDVDEEEDLEALANLLDETEGESGVPENSLSVGETTGVANPNLAELGLEVSDDEDEPSVSSDSPISSFSASFSGSKFSKSKSSPEHKLSPPKNSDYDPLEAELEQMEKRMLQLRKELSKKKKFDLKGEGTSKRTFTKLTNVTSEPKHTVRTLKGKEAQRFYSKLKNDSEIHTGETDSEDEEDNRNPFEQKYNSYGREIKNRVSHGLQDVSFSRKKEEVLERVKKGESQAPGWNKLNGSLVSLKNGGSALPATDKNVTVDQFSGIKIINPVVSQDTMRERMEGRRMVRMSTIILHLRGGDIDGDWVTMGVVVSKSPPKTSQKGSQYSIWKLSDLSDCTKTVALFLFSGAYKALWKSSVGTVVGLLNPQIMKDREGDKNTDMLTLSVNDLHKVMVMGSSADLGWCKGRTKQNSQCKYFVNKSSCEFCIYHIQREYQKSSAKRADIQSSFTRVDPRKRLQEKVLGKDQVFYGGQLYSAPSPSGMSRQTPANKAKDLATLNSLKMKLKANELKEEDKQKSFVLKHMSRGEIGAVQQVAKENENFSEKLLAPTPGARNLLRHLTKEETAKKVTSGQIRSISAKELLSMTHQQVQARKSLSTASRLSTSPSSSQPRRFSLSPSAAPEIGRGVLPGGEIDLDFSPPSQKPDHAKLRALALVQKKGGIQASNPNAIKNTKKASDPEFQDKVKKRLDTDSSRDSGEKPSKKSKLRESTSDVSPKATLNSIDVNSERFKAMLERKSRHTNLINVVENEALDKYYQGLEKKEMLEDKMASVMEIPTTAYVCLKCKYLAQSASDLCREENHVLKTVKVKKRFFECKNCKRRQSSLDKLPRKACGNCDHSSWQRVSMAKAKSGPKLESEILSLRGDELKHYSAAGSEIFLHI